MTDPLRDEIETFLRLTGMKPTRFSISATRDRHFVRKLRKGRRVWPETAHRVRAFMRGYVPGGDSVGGSEAEEKVDVAEQAEAA